MNRPFTRKVKVHYPGFFLNGKIVAATEPYPDPQSRADEPFMVLDVEVDMDGENRVFILPQSQVMYLTHDDSDTST